MQLLTLPQLEAEMSAQLTALIEAAGSVRHLGRMINYNPATIRAWIRRGRISRAGAHVVDDHDTLGEAFTFDILRPDLSTDMDLMLELDKKYNKLKTANK